MTKSADKHNNRMTTILNGKRTELTEDEIVLLFDYRISDEESQKEIRTLIESLKK